MEDNWLALGIAILSPKFVTPEEAFDLLYIEQRTTRHKPTKRLNKTINDKDIEDMMKLKFEQSYTYKEIADMYGLSADAVYGRIRRYKKKMRGGPDGRKAQKRIRYCE